MLSIPFYYCIFVWIFLNYKFALKFHFCFETTKIMMKPAWVDDEQPDGLPGARGFHSRRKIGVHPLLTNEEDGGGGGDTFPAQLRKNAPMAMAQPAWANLTTKGFFVRFFEACHDICALTCKLNDS